MSSYEQGWTGFLQDQGSNFLEWIEGDGILEKKFNALATALRSLFLLKVRTGRDATDVWKAVPAVLGCLNDPATLEKPGTASAYIWLFLLDRYARTWIALEKLVAANCLPMGGYGVRALDVGTGPGPSAFAVHDFFAAMTKFSELTGNPKWRQPASITCVEYDSKTNHLRHLLAEIIDEQSLRESDGVLTIARSLRDFSEISPTQERKKRFEALRYEEDEYYDDEAGWWTSDLLYWEDDAHAIAQSLHRYRLFMFSNFLTTVGLVACYERNLVDILHDAQPGSVLVVLGAKGGIYPQIYDCVDQLAKPAGFQLQEIPDDTVSSADSMVCDHVYEEGRWLYKYLQNLAPNDDEETQKVRSHFEGERSSALSSKLRVYRKYSRQRSKDKER